MLCPEARPRMYSLRPHRPGPAVHVSVDCERSILVLSAHATYLHHAQSDLQDDGSRTRACRPCGSALGLRFFRIAGRNSYRDGVDCRFVARLRSSDDCIVRGALVKGSAIFETMVRPERSDARRAFGSDHRYSRWIGAVPGRGDGVGTGRLRTCPAPPDVPATRETYPTEKGQMSAFDYRNFDDRRQNSQNAKPPCWPSSRPGRRPMIRR